MWENLFLFFFFSFTWISFWARTQTSPLSSPLCSLIMIALKLALVILVSHTMCRGKPRINNISCKSKQTNKQKRNHFVRHSAELQISLYLSLDQHTLTGVANKQINNDEKGKSNRTETLMLMYKISTKILHIRKKDGKKKTDTDFILPTPCRKCLNKAN